MNSFREITRKNRRQRAWFRIVLRKKLPLFRKRVHLWALQRRAAFMRWRAARIEAARVKELRAATAKARRDPNAPCPACGAREGKIFFSPIYARVIHRCSICQALFAEPPIVAWEDWKVEVSDQQLPEPMQLIEAWQARQRLTAPGITPSSPAKGPM